METERICRNSQPRIPMLNFFLQHFLLLFSDWTEHGYCYYVALKAVVLQQSRDVAVRLILVNAVVLPWIFNSYKGEKNPFFCKGKSPGAQSVSLSVESTVQYMNNTLCPLCENSFFLSVYCILPVSQTSWLIGTYFQALCWYKREIQFHREHWPFQASQNAKLEPRTKAT